MSAHDYELLATLARDKARNAMHQGNPARAREWIAAAAEAERAKEVPGPASERAADALEQIAVSLKGWDYVFEVGGDPLDRIATALEGRVGTDTLGAAIAEVLRAGDAEAAQKAIDLLQPLVDEAGRS
jgi:hypothetical protein